MGTAPSNKEHPLECTKYIAGMLFPGERRDFSCALEQPHGGHRLSKKFEGVLIKEMALRVLLLIGVSQFV